MTTINFGSYLLLISFTRSCIMSLLQPASPMFKHRLPNFFSRIFGHVSSNGCPSPTVKLSPTHHITSDNVYKSLKYLQFCYIQSDAQNEDKILKHNLETRSPATTSRVSYTAGTFIQIFCNNVSAYNRNICI